MSFSNVQMELTDNCDLGFAFATVTTLSGLFNLGWRDIDVTLVCYGVLIAYLWGPSDRLG